MESVINVWDMSLELFYTPSSKIVMKSLKGVLEMHHELIMLAEKYNILRNRVNDFIENPPVIHANMNCIFY